MHGLEKLDTMTASERMAWDNRKKQCTKCGLLKTNKDFHITSCRDKLLLRSQCNTCMKKYYGTYEMYKRKSKEDLCNEVLRLIEEIKGLVT